MTILQPQLGSSKPEEEVARSRLFKIWKHITYTLISSVAVLYKELKAANTSHEPALSDQSSLITNRESNKLNDEFNNNDNDIMMLSADESEVKDEVYDFGIPSSMIDEAADLSHYSHTLPLQSFEELLALEQSLLHRDGQHTELDETLVRSGSISSTHSESAFMAPSPLILPSSNSDQNQWLNSPNIDATLVYHFPSQRQECFVKETKIMPQQPSSALRSRKCSNKPRGIRLSVKNDLLPASILDVADRLIDKDSISYFLDNCQKIHEG